MEKITKATLKKLARKGELIGRILEEFSGMTDCNERVDKKLEFFTPERINDVWMTKNSLQRKSETEVKLSNCCYRIIFNF